MKEKGEMQILPVHCDADDLDEFILFLFHFFLLSLSLCVFPLILNVLLVRFKENESGRMNALSVF